MGLLSRMKKNTVWDDAYDAKPTIYTRPKGNVFGAFALTEGTDTILPLHPEDRFLIDGKTVSEWCIIFVSTSDETLMFELPYSQAMEKLESYIMERKDDTVLVKGLTLGDLKSIGEGNYFAL